MVEGVRGLVETAEHITSTEFVRSLPLLLELFTVPDPVYSSEQHAAAHLYVSKNHLYAARDSSALVGTQKKLRSLMNGPAFVGCPEQP